MPGHRVDASHFSNDTADFLRLLHEHRVRYLIGGGEAVVFHGHARLTGDVDLFFDRTDENARALFATLVEFWGGAVPGVARSDELLEEGLILQFGRPPNRIDLLSTIGGISFEDAWRGRAEALLAGGQGDVPIHYLGLDALIRTKEAAGRPRDLEDMKFLRRAAERDERRGR